MLKNLIGFTTNLYPLKYLHLSSLVLLIILLNTNCNMKLKNRFNVEKQPYIVAIKNLKPLNKNGLSLGVKAKDCAVCHKDIYDEWKGSIHATALADIQYQAEIAKYSSPAWLCLNCHIPIQNQREYIIDPNTKVFQLLKGTPLWESYFKHDIRDIEKLNNPKLDKEMQKEAITCAVCHIRQDDKNNSYIIGPHGSDLAPHPVKKDEPKLNKDGPKGKTFLEGICYRCHSPFDMPLTKHFVCWFKTGEELANGPYKDKKCIDCHMPNIERRLVPDNRLPIRKTRRHFWTGGGIPKWYDRYDKLLERGYISGLAVKVKNVDIIKDKVNINIWFENKNAGHDLPTGDPERFISIQVKLFDSSNKLIKQKKHFIGQRWEWMPIAKKLFDNRLKPKEARNWTANIKLPKTSKVDKIIIQALHVRVNSENAKYMMYTTGINENYLKNGQSLVKNAIDHYPMASFIFREDIDLSTKKRTKYSIEELIELSKKEKGKKLKDRDY